jgi:uncharacterized membrane protein
MSAARGQAAGVQRSHGGLELGLASALLVALVAARVVHSGSDEYGFLLWNLTLAWVPWMLARASAMAAERGWIALAWTLGGGWLLFLPNAPYLVTDFVHLGANDGAPIWYDIALLGTAALSGLMAGGLSLRAMHAWIAERHGAIVGLAVLLASVVATGLGIYLGRFQRWNSWDLVVRPGDVLGDLVALAQDPAAQARVLAVTLVFAALTGVSYAAVGGRLGASPPPRRAT